MLLGGFRQRVTDEYVGDVSFAVGVYADFAALRERLNAMIDRIFQDRKSTRLNSSHVSDSRMPSSALKKKSNIDCIYE